ncbi:hypothetical protein E3E31_07540 [Thermococcus sp. M39]|uniref:hypothetical protein n=1 Tax=Thermococcus sp. M39 TaxID=1638262 RepID=UPI00143C53FD|nr:hypothetical protein [Thermococcus sp. M39]NJE08376.1 hypothetical protein [Thermococcus sp. M39]
MEELLTYIELKSKEEKERALEFMKKITSTKNEEKRRYEVEMAYHCGKLLAYAEISKIINHDKTAKDELRRLIDKIADEVIIKKKLERFRKISKNPALKADLGSFEEGVEEFKFELFKALDLLDDVTIIEIT